LILRLLNVIKPVKPSFHRGVYALTLLILFTIALLDFPNASAQNVPAGKNTLSQVVQAGPPQSVNPTNSPSQISNSSRKGYSIQPIEDDQPSHSFPDQTQPGISQASGGVEPPQGNHSGNDGQLLDANTFTEPPSTTQTAEAKTPEAGRPQGMPDGIIDWSSQNLSSFPEQTNPLSIPGFNGSGQGSAGQGQQASPEHASLGNVQSPSLLKDSSPSLEHNGQQGPQDFNKHSPTLNSDGAGVFQPSQSSQSSKSSQPPSENGAGIPQGLPPSAAKSLSTPPPQSVGFWKIITNLWFNLFGPKK